MSMVYKAFQPSLNRYVAIKILYGHLSPHSHLRFEREARAIALLQHPNILPIYDFVQRDELDYFVMQYVDPAVSLDDYIVNGTISMVQSLHLISRVIDALDYAHSRGVIHRDIKPSNILVSREDWPLLADFGIAKMIDDSQELTPVGHVVGTASYMPPEVTRGQPVDARGDIYSIGVVLYEMLTGHVPFQGSNPLSVLMKHANEPLPPPSTSNPSIPLPVERIITRALEKDPADRYQSAAEMRTAVDATVSQLERSITQGRVTRPTRALAPTPDTPLIPPTSSAAPTTTQPSQTPIPAASHSTTGNPYLPDRSRFYSTALLILTITGMLAALVLLWIFLPRAAPGSSVNETAVAAILTPAVASTLPATPLETATAMSQPPPSIPATEQATGIPAASEIYVVQAGDTLTDIALRFGTTVDALLAANDLSDRDLIQEGQTLVIPITGTEPNLPPTAEPLSSTAIPTISSLPPSPTERSNATTVIRLEDNEWQGGYRSPSGQTYGGRSATWIYGSNTNYATMRATFTLSSAAKGTIRLRIEGMDSEGPAKTPIEIRVNETVIYSGDNPLPDDDKPLATGMWASYDLEIEPAMLRQDENEIRITNLAPGEFSRPPFFMLDYAELVLTD